MRFPGSRALLNTPTQPPSASASDGLRTASAYSAALRPEAAAAQRAGGAGRSALPAQIARQGRAVGA